MTFEYKSRRERYAVRDDVVRVTGLEPVRHRHTPLKRACLPVPAHSHIILLHFFQVRMLLYHPLSRMSTTKIYLFSPDFFPVFSLFTCEKAFANGMPEGRLKSLNLTMPSDIIMVKHSKRTEVNALCLLKSTMRFPQGKR